MLFHTFPELKKQVSVIDYFTVKVAAKEAILSIGVSLFSEEVYAWTCQEP
jgi:hypothetical protein